MSLALFAILAVVALAAGSSYSPQPSSQPGAGAGQILNGDPLVGGRIAGGIGASRPGHTHAGVDIYAASGAAVTAYLAGRVITVLDGRSSSLDSRRRAGLFVEIESADKRVSRYLHLGSALVSQGQSVSKGQQIGTVERDHLHFEIRSGSARGTPLQPF